MAAKVCHIACSCVKGLIGANTKFLISLKKLKNNKFHTFSRYCFLVEIYHNHTEPNFTTTQHLGKCQKPESKKSQKSIQAKLQLP